MTRAACRALPSSGRCRGSGEAPAAARSDGPGGAGPGSGATTGHLGPFTGLWPTLVELGQAAGARALWLHGSRVWGTHHESSDLDLAYVVGSPATGHRLRRALADVVRYEARSVDYLTDLPCEYWEHDGVELGVHILDARALRHQVRRLFTSVDDLIAGQSFAQHVIVEANPVFDDIGILPWAQHEVSSYPTDLRRRVVERYLARLERKLLWWRRRPVWKGAFEQVADLSVILHEIAGCHYALNAQFCMDGLKQYPHDLRLLVPDLRTPVTELCRVEPEDGEGQHKRSLVAGVVRELGSAHEQQSREEQDWTSP